MPINSCLLPNSLSTLCDGGGVGDGDGSDDSDNGDSGDDGDNDRVDREVSVNKLIPASEFLIFGDERPSHSFKIVILKLSQKNGFKKLNLFHFLNTLFDHFQLIRKHFCVATQSLFLSPRICLLPYFKSEWIINNKPSSLKKKESDDKCSKQDGCEEETQKERKKEITKLDTEEVSKENTDVETEEKEKEDKQGKNL